MLSLDLNKIEDFYTREVLRQLIAYISSTTSGQNAIKTITNNITQQIPLDGSVPITGDILPQTDALYSLGDPNYRLKEVHAVDMYIDANTLYVGGEPALRNDNGVVTLSSGHNKDVAIKATGTGKVILDCEADVEITTTGSVTINNALLDANVSYKVDGFGVGDLNVDGDAVLTYIPKADSENITLNGLSLTRTVDYTLLNNVVSLIYPLEAGDDLQVKYTY